MLVFIALATVMAGAVIAAAVIPVQQADALRRIPFCPPESPRGGGIPPAQQGCGPAIVPPP